MPSVARTSTTCWPGVACQITFHCTQVAGESSVASVAACHGPLSTLISTLLTPRSGAQATPATTTGPAGTLALSLGTSIRDCVRIGASLAQPRGTQ